MGQKTEQSFLRSPLMTRHPDLFCKGWKGMLGKACHFPVEWIHRCFQLGRLWGLNPSRRGCILSLKEAHDPFPICTTNLAKVQEATSLAWWIPSGTVKDLSYELKRAIVDRNFFQALGMTNLCGFLAWTSGKLGNGQMIDRWRAVATSDISWTTGCSSTPVTKAICFSEALRAWNSNRLLFDDLR